MRKLKLGVVMPVVNCLKYSQQTYESFTTKAQHHWFIIDNGSTDGTREWAESLTPNVTYIRNEENIGVAKSWNLGIAKAFEAGFDPVLVINNDLVFDTDTVDNLLEWYGEEGQNKFEFVTVTNVGSDLSLLNTYERKKTALVAPNFIGFLINSRTVKRIGWFDEGYEMAYFEDNDMHCLDGYSPILLGDGKSTMHIRQIVKNKYDGMVMSYNIDKGIFEPKKVVGWYRSSRGGRAWRRIGIDFSKYGKKNYKGVWATEDHLILSGDNEWVPVKNVKSVRTYHLHPSGLQKMLILGCMLGDSHINAGRMIIGHGSKQKDYFNFKERVLSNLLTDSRHELKNRGYSCHKFLSCSTKVLPYFGDLEKIFYETSCGIKKRTVPKNLTPSDLTDLVLAVWYMDDGTRTWTESRPNNVGARLYTCGVGRDDTKFLIKILEQLGIKCSLGSMKNEVGKIYYFIRIWSKNGAGNSHSKSSDFFRRIAPYIIPSMRYKLPPKIAEEVPYNACLWDEELRDHYEVCDTHNFEETPLNKNTNTVYCIDVEDNHNFVSSKLVFHNCRLKEECIAAAQVLDAPVVHYGSRAIKEGGVDNSETYIKNRVRFKENHGFFPELEPIEPVKEYVVNSKPRLLWVGDAVAPTGFAKVTHSVLDWLRYMWDVSVIGVNHRGDPHDYDYPIYPATVMGQGSPWGEDRLLPIISKVQPHVVLILNDHWIIRSFLNRLQKLESRPCILAYIPVDGKNVPYAERLNELDAAIFYTQFGRDQAEDGGFTGSGYVIPHGVDLRNFKSVSRDDARKSIFKEILPDNAFLFGCVNRNQGRKRQDLILYCFKKFLEATGAKDAYLYLHCAPDDMGYDLDQLTTYFGLDKKKVLMPMDNFTVWNQVKESSMHLIYNSMDVHLSTTQGEGWGLCNLESMTCGIPNILPDYAALGEWAKDAAYMVPVSSFVVNTGGLNTVGGVVDTDLFVEAMIEMYHNSSLRDHYSAKSLELAQNENFNWRNISGKFHSAMVETYKRWLEARQPT